MKTHSIKTVAPYFQDVVDGRKTFEFRLDDRDYHPGDYVVHNEYAVGNDFAGGLESTGRVFKVMIGYVLKGGVFGIPEGYCIFQQWTDWHNNPLYQYRELTDKILPKYKKNFKYTQDGDIKDQIDSLLSRYQESSENSILKAKQFMEDCKLQLKAIELMLDGLSADHLNHSQKRTIVNHVISMLRKSVDRLDKLEYNFADGIYDHYNYFRSTSPEQSLLEKYQELKYENAQLKNEQRDDDTKLPF